MNVLINIDNQSDQPIYRQIVDELIAAIQQGYLKGGEKLPSTRDLGKALGISRFTVMRSYEDLV
ncbi:MAG: GntR family transcriptional regulator, partial [Cyanobacteria bacterium SZAS TMP-1]|nr:GntR family transcriptional regulator [Cyanobacteria bacterium SZAS TMP-1]